MSLAISKNLNLQQRTLKSRKSIDLESKASNLKPISEQNEWVKEKLSDIWGEDKADYYTNPNRTVKPEDKQKEEDFRNSLYADPNNQRRKPRSGLYAYMIWDVLRDESQNRLKSYNLEKELQNTMNLYERNYKNSRLTNSDEDIFKQNKQIDTSKIKQAKILRNEIELMYRSSKMNQERVNVMRANSPLPDVNDIDGKNSIVRYLPPIFDINDESKNIRINSSLEFISSPSMKHKYKQRLDAKITEKQELKSTNFNLVDYKIEKRQPKLEIQNVKLHFLQERPFTDYLIRNEEIAGTNTPHQDILGINDEKPKAMITYKEKSQSEKSKFSYPPLSMNALMEYKTLIKAPGIGEFDNGKPKLFKLN